MEARKHWLAVVEGVQGHGLLAEEAAEGAHGSEKEVEAVEEEV